MQNQITKLKTLIGFSLRSKTIIYGFDNVKTTRKKQKLIIACKTITDKNLNKIVLMAKERNIPVVKMSDEYLLSEFILRENVKVIGLLNEDLAKAILKDESGLIFKTIKEVQ